MTFFIPSKSPTRIRERKRKMTDHRIHINQFIGTILIYIFNNFHYEIYQQKITVQYIIINLHNYVHTAKHQINS